MRRKGSEGERSREGGKVRREDREKKNRVRGKEKKRGGEGGEGKKEERKEGWKRVRRGEEREVENE